jgi:hypothetical protein
MNTVNLGLRNGGGIGDSLKITMYNDNKSDYLPKVVLVNILFFLIINLVFLNIIFGIIIDTFGELRDGIFERGILTFFLIVVGNQGDPIFESRPTPPNKIFFNGK